MHSEFPDVLIENLILHVLIRLTHLQVNNDYYLHGFLIHQQLNYG